MRHASFVHWVDGLVAVLKSIGLQLMDQEFGVFFSDFRMVAWSIWRIILTFTIHHKFRVVEKAVKNRNQALYCMY